MNKFKMFNAGSVSTYRQALTKAMKKFLMAPFFQNVADVEDVGHFKTSSSRRF